MSEITSKKTANDKPLNNSSVLIAECVNNLDRWTNKKESNLIVGEQYIVEFAVIFSSRTIVKRPYLELHTDKFAYKGVTRIVRYKSATEESLNEIVKLYRCVPIIDRSVVG